jgi:hypothetical protein
MAAHCRYLAGSDIRGANMLKPLSNEMARNISATTQKVNS